MSLHNNRQNGFTLVEVLVAIVILATGLLLVIEGMGRSQTAIKISENLVQASFLLEQKITELEMEVLSRKKLPFGSDEGKLKIPGREFLWHYQIKPYSAPSVRDQTQISQAEVSVKWRESGRVNDLLMQSLLVNVEQKK